MARITVLGGTGYGGGAVVAEAARRGHRVLAVSRTAPRTPVPQVRYVTGSVLDHGVLERAVSEADVVFEALSPRGDMAGKVEGMFTDLLALAQQHRTRLGVLGGASSLLVAADGPRLLDLAPVPPEVRPEVDLGIHRNSRHCGPPPKHWTGSTSAPPPSSAPGCPAPGRARIASATTSCCAPRTADRISAADLAIAVVDEIEHPTHHRRRFHVAH